MPLVLNTDQLQLKDQARKLVKAKLPVEQLRKLRDTKDERGFSVDTWKEMSELGWAGILIPEAFGGAGLGYQELGVLLEETGRHLVASPLWSTALAGATALIRGADDAVKKELLPQVAAGKALLALAVDEKPHHDPLAVFTKAEPAGSGFRLTGKKILVADGHVAGWLVVSAAAPSGLTVFLVKADAPGVKRSRRWTADSRGWAEIELAGAEAHAVLGEKGKGAALLDWILDAGRIGLAAEMLGGISEAYERTLDYLKVRQQFGVLIGSFQALQHRAAQMFCEVELCRSLVRDALSALDEDRKDLPQTASAAKVHLSEVFHLVTNEAVQMHGGIGVTDEHEIGFFLKRARVAEHLLGSAGFHRSRYAALSGY